MPQIARRTDVIEEHASRAIPLGIGAIVAFALAALLFVFRGDGYLLGLAWVLVLAGVACVAYAIYLARQAKRTSSYWIECIYCHDKFELLEPPGNEDVACLHCHRLIPIQDNQPLPVSEVRCGFCNSLNFYSAKSQFLICENCDREIPITVGEDVVPKNIPKGYIVEDDERTYSLTLDQIPNPEHPSEELISALQQMLALNRSQVKQMLVEVPTTLLVGIPKKKAEMLSAQLSVHGATANYSSLD